MLGAFTGALIGLQERLEAFAAATQERFSANGSAGEAAVASGEVNGVSGIGSVSAVNGPGVVRESGVVKGGAAVVNSVSAANVANAANVSTESSKILASADLGVGAMQPGAGGAAIGFGENAPGPHDPHGPLTAHAASGAHRTYGALGEHGTRGAHGNSFSASFISGTSIFCVGSMAVLGPVEEGLLEAFPFCWQKRLWAVTLPLTSPLARARE